MGMRSRINDECPSCERQIFDSCGWDVSASAPAGTAFCNEDCVTNWEDSGCDFDRINRVDRLREQVANALWKCPMFHSMKPDIGKALQADQWSPEAQTFARLALMLQAAMETQSAQVATLLCRQVPHVIRGIQR